MSKRWGCETVILAALAVFACVGCSSSAVPHPPPATPTQNTTPPTQTVTLSPSGETVSFARLASGASGSVTFPDANDNSWPRRAVFDVTARLTFQLAPPRGVPPPSAQNLGAMVSPLAYVTLSSSDTATFRSMPVFAFTFPSGMLTGNMYLAFFDSNNAVSGWTAVAGPVKPSGATVSFSAPTLWQTYYANSTYVYAVVQTSATLPAQIVPMGPDYGLRRQCVRGLSPAQPNFWFSDVDCPGGVPATHDWVTLIEIENGGPVSPCVGSASGQSVLLNGPGSVATEQWMGSSSIGYSVDMRIDYTNAANACGPTTFSYIGLQDDPDWNGAAEARPDQSVVDFDVTWNRTLGNGGLAAVGVATGESWQATGFANPIGFNVAINTGYDPGECGCGGPPPGSPPDVLFSNFTPPQGGSPAYYTVLYDGSKLNPPIQTPPGFSGHITVNWGQLTAHAIAEGLVPPPINGWANSDASSGGTTFNFELRNTIAGPGGPMGDMVVSSVRESALLPLTGAAMSVDRERQNSHKLPLSEPVYRMLHSRRSDSGGEAMRYR